jgi:hypothetical protein
MKLPFFAKIVSYVYQIKTVAINYEQMINSAQQNNEQLRALESLSGTLVKS